MSGVGLDSRFVSPKKAFSVRKPVPCWFDFPPTTTQQATSRHSQAPDYPSHKISSGCPHKATPTAILEGSRSHGRTSRLPTRGAADSAHQGSEGPASDEDNAAYLKVSLSLPFSALYSKRQEGPSSSRGEAFLFLTVCSFARHHE